MMNYEGQQDALFDMGSEGEPAQPAGSEVIEALDRLDIMKRQAGFLPTSRRELNEAYSLLSFTHEPGGAGLHLAKIAGHQRRHGADVPRTLRGVIAGYVAYARRARTDRTNLVTLHEELAEADSVDRLSSPAGHVYTGLGQLVRYIDLSNLALNKHPADFPFMPLHKYTDSPTPDDYVVTQPSPEVAARIKDVMESTSKWEAERWVASAIDDQRQRQDFWTERLQEIKQHYTYTGPVRAMARRALEDLGIR